MGIALAKVRGRVRSRLRDADGRMNSPSTVEIDMQLASSWIELSSLLPSPVLYTASAFTIAAGATTFSLPVTVTSSGYGTGTTEYNGDVRIQLASTGTYLRRLSHTEMDALTWGVTVVPLAIPDSFALYMDSAQVVRGRCWPGALAAQACNLWATLSAEDLRDYVGTGGTEGMDTVTVPGTREAVQALEAHASAMLVARMDDKAIALRGLNPKIADAWMRECDGLLYEEEKRQHALKSIGRVQRFKA